MIALLRLKYLSRKVYRTSPEWDMVIKASIDNIGSILTLRKWWRYCFDKEFMKFIKEKVKWYEERRFK